MTKAVRIFKLLEMKPEKINYSDVMALGFTDSAIEYPAYYRKHGYGFSYVLKELTEQLCLYWVPHTRLCEMVRVDNQGLGLIKKRMPINDLKHLTEVVSFFTDKEE